MEPEIHYRVHQDSALDYILNQMNPVYINKKCCI
jgi:hypothetical protein